MFAAGVWTFSKGGVEGGGEVDLFFMHCFGHLQKRSVKFKIKRKLGYFRQTLYFQRHKNLFIILKVGAILLNKHGFCLDFY